MTINTNNFDAAVKLIQDIHKKETAEDIKTSILSLMLPFATDLFKNVTVEQMEKHLYDLPTAAIFALYRYCYTLKYFVEQENPAQALKMLSKDIYSLWLGIDNFSISKDEGMTWKQIC